MWVTTVALFLGMLAVSGYAVVRLVQPSSHPCRACDGLGVRRGHRGRWAGFCSRCRGSGQVDSIGARLLVSVTRGRVLPAAGAAAPGAVQHGQGYRFAGSRPGRRGSNWVAAPDPADTRLAALEDRRIPALERRVERREAALAGSGGLVWLAERARLAAARRALRRARDAAERHRAALEVNAGGYRARRR